MRTPIPLVAVLVAAFAVAACGSDDAAPDEPADGGAPDAAASDDGASDDGAAGDDADDDGTDTPDDGDAEALSGELTVFAAASLTDAFTELESSFEAEHPDLDVIFNFASSSTLATQAVEGAPVDVFASANDTQMAVVTDADLATGPAEFTTNVLEIVVEAGNPLGIADLEDLTDPDVILVLAAPEVPAGQFADEMLTEQGIEVTPSSLEVDVRATLSKVELGEADVAIVYRSDVVTASDTVEGVEIPADRNVVASYPIVQMAEAANPDAAAAWIAFVEGPEGQAALDAAGFTAP